MDDKSSENAKRILERLKADARDVRRGSYRADKLVVSREGKSHTTFRLETSDNKKVGK